MKKLLVLAALVGLVFAFQPVDQVEAKGHKVWICHFDGHNAGPGLFDDRAGVLVFPGDEAKADACRAAGAEVIHVAWQGACNGHGVRAACR